MLLRIGVVSLCFSLTLALVVTILTSYGYAPGTRAAEAEAPVVPERPSAAEHFSTTERPSATERSSAPEPATPVAPPRPAFLPDLQEQRPAPRPKETPQRGASSGDSARESTREAAPPPDPAPRKQARPRAKPGPGQPRQGRPARAAKTPEPKPDKPAPKASKREAPDKRKSGTGERADRGKSGRPGPALGTAMNLTIESIGLRDAPVESTGRQRALDNGLIRMPQSSLPWDRGPTRNVYVVGHRLGWPGTASWKVFYELDELRRGDEVALTDRRGKVYRYRVSERFVVDPSEVGVMDRVRGRDMVTLQTCTGLNFQKRLIVRADRI
ncbi:MAG: sortase [Actinomycetota bacterium]|nr:sortase [Actinomycetota bacterium]